MPIDVLQNGSRTPIDASAFRLDPGICVGNINSRHPMTGSHTVSPGPIRPAKPADPNMNLRPAGETCSCICGSDKELYATWILPGLDAVDAAA